MCGILTGLIAFHYDLYCFSTVTMYAVVQGLYFLLLLIVLVVDDCLLMSSVHISHTMIQIDIVHLCQFPYHLILVVQYVSAMALVYPVLPIHSESLGNDEVLLFDWLLFSGFLLSCFSVNHCSINEHLC